jgi:hypothetical protein
MWTLLDRLLAAGLRRPRRSIRQAPIGWHPPLQTPRLAKRFREAGFWAATAAETISFIDRHP